MSDATRNGRRVAETTAEQNNSANKRRRSGSGRAAETAPAAEINSAEEKIDEETSMDTLQETNAANLIQIADLQKQIDDMRNKSQTTSIKELKSLMTIETKDVNDFISRISGNVTLLSLSQRNNAISAEMKTAN